MTSTDTAMKADGLGRIRKRSEDFAGANLRHYDEYARTFSWTQARALLDGLPGGGLNIAYEAVDRHVKAGHGSKLALRWIGRDDTIRDFTYATLSQAAPSPISMRNYKHKCDNNCLSASIP